jgi:hypothetical protein
MNANCIHIYSVINLTIPNFNFDSKVKFGTSHYFFKKSLNTNGNTKKKVFENAFQIQILSKHTSLTDSKELQMIAESSKVGVDKPNGIGKWCGAGDCSMVELGTPVPVPMFWGVFVYTE